MDAKEKTKIRKVLLWILDLAINIGVIFILVLVIQKWLIAPFDISGSSMCDTLNNISNECVNDYGEKIIINEATYLFNKPQRGDIVVFKTDASGDKYFIKRVIGLPGETIELKDGYVYLTKVGETTSAKLEENYLNEANKGNTKPYFSDMKVFNVPEDHYFLLGDNRKESTDARSCFESMINDSCRQNKDLSYVDIKAIRGKAWIVWWPLQDIRILHNPVY